MTTTCETIKIAPSQVRIWTGSQTARVTDMTNAGKRGKKCRQFVVISGRESAYVSRVLECIKESDGVHYDSLRATVLMLIEQAKEDGVDAGRIIDEEIRGVDAPCVRLVAGIPGAWHGQADEDGVSVYDDSDRHNLPAAMSRGRTSYAAYKIAAKVWDRVREAKTMHEASEILSEAGLSMHYWCRMD